MNRVQLEKKVLNENDRIAASLRQHFAEKGTLCLNLISSPGSGKTTLLEKTLESFLPNRRVAVLTGDIQTQNDALRLQRFGFPVKQITTGGTCHLTASMVERHLADWHLQPIELLFIENVGNLVCPASYDLGEAAKIVLLSVTEGEDKPLKYPSTFFKAELAVLTKMDLLPHVPFSLGAVEENLRRVHPGIDMLKLSCTRGEGIEDWLEWLKRRVAKAEAKPRAFLISINGQCFTHGHEPSLAAVHALPEVVAQVCKLMKQLSRESRTPDDSRIAPPAT